jgi:hypothetical protein
MRALVIVGLLAGAGCAEDVLEMGDVQVIETGTGRVEVSICVDIQGRSCAESPQEITLEHDGIVTTVPYGGFIFGSYDLFLEVADVTAPFVLTHGYAQADITLPDTFDLTSSTTRLGRGGEVTVTWQRGTSPMAWDLSFSCSTGGGWARGGTVDDSAGTLTLAGSDIFDRIDGFDPRTCKAALRLMRVQNGTLDRHFGADLATGIVRRSVGLDLVQ